MGISSILYSTAYITITANIKEFLAFSSINQTGYVLTLFVFKDILIFYVALLFLLAYIIASVLIYLILSSARSTTVFPNELDIET